ncbi:uncharacterized protein LOC126993896 [Eriocheir sinensis]|uniref:uncharacterized protein LOC126993896 n=1 Tax=Eriocheir sinensis TaxID=95602 RepID=UPI0021C8DDE4|nr:uncharacterized protein LOC126993896 [Eriocheir sinensis]
MKAKRILVVLVMAATLLVGPTEAGWLENFSENLCRTDIRCYSKTYYCTQLLNVHAIQRSMTQVLAYCYSLLGSTTLRTNAFTEDDLIAVMSGVHGEQLPNCVLVQMGLLVNGQVNQAQLYLSLANVVVSSDATRQNNFLDSITTCPEPSSRQQLATFGACVIQSCAASL